MVLKGQIQMALYVYMLEKISFKHPTKEEKIYLEASVPKEDIWKNI